ncbi:class I SAM-dependent methyltransferase [Streptomyces armeniacus]|uniref:Class I SAM-dependent methyltransferase n=1 Tax=Streptomyces armeniacus TaxID=83291 RepID=A0A345XR71_9ACTN|nr:class I SAM-dependent methyltransferase [Streptomyces armeniacus]AXK34137.1 class I SAM-dependent methyltransferase [Streptomyces armeniacus]
MTEPDYVHATRTSYDTIAADYARHAAGELAAKPLDRGMLAGFADLVRTGGGGGGGGSSANGDGPLPVLEVGCGTGRVTAHLAGLGLPASGVDLSPEMIAVARQSEPGLRFDVGSMLSLDAPDGSLGGVVAWYSVIHIEEEQLPAVFAEFHRVLAPGGHVLLAFQVGDEPLRLTEAYGRPIALDFHRRRPEQIAALLDDAGLPVRARLLREADDEGDFTERTPQAFLLARKRPTA